MKHKTKIAILVATLFASVALLNVGFAAWVFSNQAQKVYEAGVSTEMVSDRSCVLEDVTEEYLGAVNTRIHFGVPQKQEGFADPWFASWSDTDTESLTYKRALKVSKNIVNLSILFDVDKISGKPDKDPDADFSDAVKKNLITTPVCIVSDAKDGNESVYFESPTVQKEKDYIFNIARKTDYDYDAELLDTVIIYVTIKFDWGSHFNNQNPYFYYNAMERNDEIEGAYTFTGEEPNIWVDTSEGQTAQAYTDAFASLYELNNLVDGLKYRFLFEGKAEKL